MHIDYTTEQQQLRCELQDYFRRLITPEIREKLRGNEGGGQNGQVYKDVIRQMAKDNWPSAGRKSTAARGSPPWSS